MKFTDFKAGQTVVFDEHYSATILAVYDNCVYLRVNIDGRHVWVYDINLIL